ncbi:MAG: hypothetical protein KF774_19760 [Planctomyces sp.]|nr:hypothetical protein [Planctomyces sp.]
MTCDDAFDAMTDPRRGGDPDLSLHLSGCPRCRAMSETLAPALELIHAGVRSHVEERGAGATADSAELAVAAADRLSGAWGGRPAGGSLRNRTRIGVGAALAVGFAAAAVALNSSAPTARKASRAPVVCLWQDRDAADRLPVEYITAACASCHHLSGP